MSECTRFASLSDKQQGLGHQCSTLKGFQCEPGSSLLLDQVECPFWSVHQSTFTGLCRALLIRNALTRVCSDQRLHWAGVCTPLSVASSGAETQQRSFYSTPTKGLSPGQSSQACWLAGFGRLLCSPPYQLDTHLVVMYRHSTLCLHNIIITCHIFIANHILRIQRNSPYPLDAHQALALFVPALTAGSFLNARWLVPFKAPPPHFWKNGTASSSFLCSPT